MRVTDFGCVRLGAAGSAGSLVQPVSPPDYLAPEQLLEGQAFDERTDVWGLGAVLYELVTGSPPFGHLESASDVATAVTTDDVPHVQDRAPWVSAELALVVHRALSRDPARRAATLEDFTRTLKPLSQHDERIAFAGLAAVPHNVRTRAEPRADLDSEPPPTPAPAPPQKPADDLGLVGQTLDARYRVVRLIGRGGMGTVYEVEASDGRRLAAKVVSRGHAGEAGLARFSREAKAASAISSPNVVTTLDAGSDETLRHPYIIMELLHGVDLSSVLKREGALEPQVAVRVVLQAARGIAAAHAHGIIHRDIKPANLFLQVAENTGDVTVKVCDFGVAKRTRIDGRTGGFGLSLTRTGGMLGSPMYMAPEQARNAKDVDERADVWSLAVVLWEALSGRRLWGQQTSLAELIVSICTDPIRRVDEVAPWVPPDLARVVNKGLERDVSRRTLGMHALIAGLEVFAGGSDRVTATDLTGLSEEHREILARRTATSLAPRADRPSSPRKATPSTAVAAKRALTVPSAHRQRHSTAVIAGLAVALLIVVAAGIFLLR